MSNAPSRRELFVGNLVYKVTDETLRELFSEAGNVESAKVIMDRETGRSRGFGFVTMKTDEEASAAIEKLNNRNVEDRAMRVNYSEANEQRGPRSGGGGSGSRPSGNRGGGGSFQSKPYGSRDRY